MNVDDADNDELPLGTELEKLRDAYLAASPRDPAGAVAHRAIMAEAETVRVSVTAWSGRRVAFAGLVSLAAAAAVLVTVVDRNDASPPASVAPADAAADSAASISVEVPEGRNAIVFATRNPLISVVWIY